jgi:hypothetical protein
VVERKTEFHEEMERKDKEIEDLKIELSSKPTPSENSQTASGKEVILQIVIKSSG